MASKERKKLQKRKEREKKVRKQILAQREIARQPEREEREQRRKIKRIMKLKRDMGKLNVWADDVLMSMNESTLTQLEKNAKILKVLEEEYEREHAKKKELNDKLEEEGFLTLDEKLNVLHKRMAEHAKMMHDDAEAALPVEEQGEVADVEVVKAPGYSERMVDSPDPSDRIMTDADKTLRELCG